MNLIFKNNRSNSSLCMHILRHIMVLNLANLIFWASLHFWTTVNFGAMQNLDKPDFWPTLGLDQRQIFDSRLLSGSHKTNFRPTPKFYKPMPPNRPTQHFNPRHRHTHKSTQTRHPRNPQTLPNLRTCRTSNEVSWEFCRIFKSTYFVVHLVRAASELCKA